MFVNSSIMNQLKRGLQVLTTFCLLTGLAVADVDQQENPCVGKHGVFVPKPGNCNEYFICMEGKPLERTCGQNHFNARLGVCDSPKRAGCINIQTNSQPLSQSICFDRKDGTKLPVDGSSSKYIVCIEGNAQLEDCGQLTFDRNERACVLPRPLKQLLPPCSGKPNGLRVPVEGDPRKYYLCMNNRPFVKSCGDMFFNPQTASCSFEPHSKTLMESSSQLKAVIPPTEDRIAVRICQGHKFGARIAVPGTCSQYYICMGNSATLKSCGQMQFNPQGAVCDVPSSVRCSVNDGVSVYESKDKRKPEATRNVTVCQGQRDASLIPMPGDCSSYFFCFKNTAIVRSCGKRHFSPITMSCVDLEASFCVDEKPADLKVKQHSPMIETAADCSALKNGALLKHPTDCGKFLICDNQMAVEMRCPAGLHFSVEENVCDWPHLAKCSLLK